MKTSLDCIPCFMRQTLEASRFITSDPQQHQRILREVLRHSAAIDFDQSPPAFAQWLHRTLRELTGVEDPYLAAKEKFNALILNMFDNLAAKVRQADDPLEMALRLAIAGNVIDLGVNAEITDELVLRSIDNILHEPFDGDVDAFREETGCAGNILYLADNAGEIVFDVLLVRELLKCSSVTVAVRGNPILNDATMADARAVGMCDLTTVIDNGSDAPGTILEDCSETFRRHFEQADLIIAKGQGNFETLSDVEANIIFLLKAKCPVIAAHVGLPVGTHIARHAGKEARND